MPTWTDTGTYTNLPIPDDADLMMIADVSAASGSQQRTITVAQVVTATNGVLTINAQTGTTYTLALTDAGRDKLLTLENAAAITLTVPTNAAIPFPVGSVVDCAQLGAGLVTTIGDTGVTINGTTPGSKASAGQWSAWRLVKLATDTWLASGDLA